jgi:hypothetical protein
MRTTSSMDVFKNLEPDAKQKPYLLFFQAWKKSR